MSATFDTIPAAATAAPAADTGIPAAAPHAAAPAAASIEPPFTELVDQPYVARFLSAACKANKQSHAYLFVGPLGAGKTEASHLLARALLCPKGGCGMCDDCIRVMRKTHPDYHVIEPLGASSYLVEQTKELIRDVSFAPMRAAFKVYLITRADLLKGAPANALLKTLEEPLGNVTFILLARTREAVLPTLLSRCQVLPFRRVPEDEALDTLVRRTGASKETARRAFAATGNSRIRAEEFLLSKERSEMRVTLIETLERLPRFDDLEVLEAVKTLFVLLKQPLDVVKIEQQMQLEASKDYLGKGGLKQLEQQHRRELTSRERQNVEEALNIIRSWLRDILLVTLGKTEELVNGDFQYHIRRIASSLDEAAVARLVAAADKAQEQMQYNVSKELALEVLLYALRDEFAGAGLK